MEAWSSSLNAQRAVDGGYEPVELEQHHGEAGVPDTDTTGMLKTVMAEVDTAWNGRRKKRKVRCRGAERETVWCCARGWGPLISKATLSAYARFSEGCFFSLLHGRQKPDVDDL